MTDESPVAVRGNGGSEDDDPPVDEFVFNLIALRLSAQLDRIDKIDAKIGAVIAAIIAAIGFALASDRTPLDYLLSLLYVLPLGLAVFAFRTQVWDDAPDPAYFAEKYEEYPEASKRAAITRMIQAYNTNKNRIEDKAKKTNVALLAAVTITGIFMVVRLGEAYVNPEVTNQSGQVTQAGASPKPARVKPANPIIHVRPSP